MRSDPRPELRATIWHTLRSASSRSGFGSLPPFALGRSLGMNGSSTCTQTRSAGRGRASPAAVPITAIPTIPDKLTCGEGQALGPVKKRWSKAPVHIRRHNEAR